MIKHLLHTTFASAVVFLLPLFAGATFHKFAPTSGTSGSNTPNTFAAIVDEFLSILNLLFPFLFIVAVIVFFWGLAKYVFRADEEPVLEQGKFLMTWGLLAIFVLASIWGILAFFYGEFAFKEQFGQFLLPTDRASQTCPPSDPSCP
ncbi:MAG: pilin [Candidatus Paceibacterota bacterium]